MPTLFDVFWFVLLLTSILIGLKMMCNLIDKSAKKQKELDEIWDQNGWSRPNKKQ